MIRSFLLGCVLGALGSTCFINYGQAAEIAFRLPTFLHSHNDYRHKRPLYDALANHFDSIEADIWLTRQDIMISHLGAIFVGSLKEVYLDPLQARVSQQGSVYGDGKPFYLWIDIKDGDLELIEKLHKLLSQYPMTTTFSDSGISWKPVVVILTGNERSKKAYVDKFPIRYACRDSNSFNIADPQADNKWLWYSLKWDDYVRWSGRSKFPQLEKQKFSALTHYIHEKGRKIRFWDTPETESFWQAAVSAKVDMIGTDQLSQVSKFAQEHF